MTPINESNPIGLMDVPERVLSGCFKGPIKPGIYAEDLLQHLGMDAVMALRPFTGREEGHVVKAVARERDAHMSYAPGVAAQLESQAIGAANKASGTARRHEALATELGKHRLRYCQIAHSFAPSLIVPPYVAQSAARVQNLT